MPRGRQAIQIQVTERQRAMLEEILRRSKSPQRDVRRASIILQAADGKPNKDIAADLNIHEQTVRDWRGRWAEAFLNLEEVESEIEDKELKALILSVLSDTPRNGRPATFSAEQICQILAVACEEAQESARPVSHWTPRELAEEVVQRGIVESISTRSVGRFLKSGGIETPSVKILADSRTRQRS